jgi:hypothetical protein
MSRKNKKSSFPFSLSLLLPDFRSPNSLTRASHRIIICRPLLTTAPSLYSCVPICYLLRNQLITITIRPHPNAASEESVYGSLASLLLAGLLLSTLLFAFLLVCVRHQLIARRNCSADNTRTGSLSVPSSVGTDQLPHLSGMTSAPINSIGSASPLKGKFCFFTLSSTHFNQS